MSERKEERFCRRCGRPLREGRCEACGYVAGGGAPQGAPEGPLAASAAGAAYPGQLPPAAETAAGRGRRPRFCRRCGHEIRDGVCTGCGRGRRSRWPLSARVTAALLTALCLLFAALGALSLWRSAALRAELTSSTRLVADLREMYSALAQERDDLSLEESLLRSDYNMMRRTVVYINADEGDGLYHDYECTGYLHESFYAFNPEYARYLGYSPCPVCQLGD